jgi:hypothetical protein
MDHVTPPVSDMSSEPESDAAVLDMPQARLLCSRRQQQDGARRFASPNLSLRVSLCKSGVSLRKPASDVTVRITHGRQSRVDANIQRNSYAKLFRAEKNFFRFSFHLQHASENVPASVATVRSLKLKSKTLRRPSSRGHNPEIPNMSFDANRVAPSIVITFASHM